MLVLSRQRDESIVIGDDIIITIVDIRGDKVRLGIDAPKDIPVHRKEVYEAIKKASLTSPQEKPPQPAEVLGPIFNPDGSMSDMTKSFARANSQYVYAEVKVPPHISFPFDMQRYDDCEVDPAYAAPLSDGDTGKQRFILVRRLRSSTKSWSPDRWQSFSCPIEVISGDVRKRPDTYVPRKENHKPNA